MAKKKRSMRTIQRVLQLRHEHGLTIRETARSTGLPASTVGEYLQEAEAAGLSWPLPEGLTEKNQGLTFCPIARDSLVVAVVNRQLRYDWHS